MTTNQVNEQHVVYPVVAVDVHGVKCRALLCISCLAQNDWSQTHQLGNATNRNDVEHHNTKDGRLHCLLKWTSTSAKWRSLNS